MTRHIDTDDELFREELIAHGVPVYERKLLPGDEDRAASELARILALPRDGAASVFRTEETRVTQSRWIRWPIAATAAALLVAAFLFVPWDGGHVAQAGTPPLLGFDGVDPRTLPASGEPASNELHDLAGKASELPYDEDQPVQHIVVDSWLSESGIEANEDAQSVIWLVQRASYFFPDDTLVNIERRSGPLDQHGRLDPSTTEPDAQLLSAESFPMPDPGAEYVESLPTDPAALRTVLLEGFDAETLSKSPGGVLLAQVTELTRFHVLPPRLHSAIWEMLADEPDISLLGTSVDRWGREALVFSTPALDGYSQHLLLADPDSGAIIGDEMVLVKQSPAYSFEPPAVTSFNSITRAERIPLDEVPDVP